MVQLGAGTDMPQGGSLLVFPLHHALPHAAKLSQTLGLRACKDFGKDRASTRPHIA
jgi:hypothetical protein